MDISSHTERYHHGGRTIISSFIKYYGDNPGLPSEEGRQNPWTYEGLSALLCPGKAVPEVEASNQIESSS